MQFTKINVLALSLLVASADAFVPSASTLRVAPRLAKVPSFGAMMSNNGVVRHENAVAMNMAAAVSEEAAPAEEEDGGGATVTELIFNLVKGIVGAGMSRKLRLSVFWCKLLTPPMLHCRISGLGKVS